MTSRWEKKPYYEQRWWWPTCPVHRDRYVRAIKGWIYCKGVGWHGPAG